MKKKEAAQAKARAAREAAARAAKKAVAAAEAAAAAAAAPRAKMGPGLLARRSAERANLTLEVSADQPMTSIPREMSDEEKLAHTIHINKNNPYVWALSTSYPIHVVMMPTSRESLRLPTLHRQLSDAKHILKDDGLLVEGSCRKPYCCVFG
eukprot:TRINITY_DN26856_c0_g1_i1.p1 TRINITY_DN26856_c0_g1~~TRINITY_DN26856_c0_g1_i1.p1  ORF type:complete len:152 (+),score=38.46 TRINITY_DN26856_c0_g1_i1:233-688(+)